MAIKYTVSPELWEEGLGNHRVLISLKDGVEDSIAAVVTIPWRRRDSHPERKRLIITDSKGRYVSRIHRMSLNTEKAEILFTLRSGTRDYYLYYMPFRPQRSHGYFRNDYLRRERGLSKIQQISLLKSACEAEVKEFQARTEFDSFYPMELPLYSEEASAFFNSNDPHWIAVAENREFPVKMTEHIPLRWYEREELDCIEAKVRRNEYFAFQIAAIACGGDLEDLSVSVEDPGPFRKEDFCCYNTQGVDIDGNTFHKKVHVKKGKIQPLWMGLDISRETETGFYALILRIKAAGLDEKRISVKLNVLNEILEDRGDSRPELFSRIRWMNSRIGLEDSVISPYKALVLQNHEISLTDKTLKLGDLGLPCQISSTQNLLASDIRFTVKPDSGVSIDSGVIEFSTVQKSLIRWRGENIHDGLEYVLKGCCEPDGTVLYEINLKSEHDLSLKDISLEIPLLKSSVPYAMGMGLRGGRLPRKYKSRWKGPWNSFWAGSTGIGLHCTFLGSDYEGPMQNLYKPDPPQSWFNGGRGRIMLTEMGETVLLKASTGSRIIKADETLTFRFSFLITPVKPVDTKSQFRDRYFHNPKPEDSASAGRCKVANIHHASDVNPYINYPFLRVGEMKKRIKEFADLGMKTKIYYTVRELSSRVCELPFLLSLGEEVLSRTPRKGFFFRFNKSHPWLREHIDDGYGAEWYAPLEDGTVDTALLTSGESRWYNYYLEGLDWLVKEQGIDGLYLDDVSYDRRILKRMRRILDQKPGSLIDLHSNTKFSRGPAVQYTGFFPYLNKLWFGEMFHYNRMTPDQWLVECSGIPFGHMADMLQAGGNRFRGMVYGMTVRLPWVSDKIKADPLPVWKVWDDFGIEDSIMKGYWEPDCPVKTDNRNIKASTYNKSDKILISVASWSLFPCRCTLDINWDSLGLNKADVIMIMPEIKDFQKERHLIPGESFMIKPGKGFLIEVKR